MDNDTTDRGPAYCYCDGFCHHTLEADREAEKETK